jgi:cell division protein FtsA
MKDLITGIDIGSFSTRVVVANPASQTQPPQVVGFGVSDTEGVRRGYIVNPEKAERTIRHAISRAEKMVDAKIKNAYVAVSGQSMSSDIVDVSIIVSKGDGQVTQFDLDALEEKAEQTFLNHKKNKKVLHTIPLYFQLDGEDIMGHPIGMHGTKIEARFLFISILEHHFEELVNVVNAAGIDIIDVVAAPLALSGALLSAKQRTVGIGLLDIGSEITTLSLFENDRVLGITTLPIGSSDVTNDIALGLKITLEEAKKVKEDYHTKDFSYPKRKVAEIISARLGDIFEMTNKYLSAHKRKGLLPAGILITGGGSLLNEIQGYAETALELPITISNIHQRFGRTVKPLTDSRWMVAYSLCFLDVEARPHFANTFVNKVLKNISRFFESIVEQFMP